MLQEVRRIVNETLSFSISARIFPHFLHPLRLRNIRTASKLNALLSAKGTS
jgi:hypothetical protein